MSFVEEAAALCSSLEAAGTDLTAIGEAIRDATPGRGALTPFERARVLAAISAPDEVSTINITGRTIGY